MTHRPFSRVLAILLTLAATVAASVTLLSSPSTAAVDAESSPWFVGRTVAANVSKTLKIAAPRGTVAGDLQVVAVGLSSRHEYVRPPRGWTTIGSLGSTSRGYRGGSFRLKLFASRSATTAVFAKNRRTPWHIVRSTYRDAASIDQVRLVGRVGRTHVLPPVVTSEADDVVLGGLLTTGVPGMSFATARDWRTRYGASATRRAVTLHLDDTTVAEPTRISSARVSSRADASIAFSLLVKGHKKVRSGPTSSPTPIPTSSPTPVATSSPTPTEAPSPTPTVTSSPTPTVTPTEASPSAPPTATTSPNSLMATITALTGQPWRQGTSSSPGYVNTTVPGSPVLNSAETAIVRALPTAILNNEEYTEPIYYSTTSTALRKVTCIEYGCVGGTQAALTGNELVAPGSDGQLVVVDTERRRSYEFYKVAKDADGTVKINSDGSVTVGAMAVVDLDGRGNKTAEGQNLNITGAGVSRIFGVIRANEVRAAAANPATAIPHGLQISLPTATNCSRTFREPATKTDGRATSTNCVEEGARVQMDPSFNCGTLSVALGRAICFSLQKYGAFVMDNSGSNGLVFYGQHLKSWSTGRSDYAAAGVTWDYASMGIPNSRLRVLSRWDGG